MIEAIDEGVSSTLPGRPGEKYRRGQSPFHILAPPVPNDPFPVPSPPSHSFPHGSYSSSTLLFTLWGNPFYTSCCSQIPLDRDPGSKRRWEVWEPSPRWKKTLRAPCIFNILPCVFLFSSVLIVPPYYECVITPLWQCLLRLSSWRMISVLMGSDMIPLMEV